MCGDIITTVDVDECATNLHNCSNEENRKCNNTYGGFNCVCADGYEEDSSQRCVGKNGDSF